MAFSRKKCRTKLSSVTAQKMKFSIKNYFSKCDKISSSLRIWSHLLKKTLMEKSIFLCSVSSQKHYTIHTSRRVLVNQWKVTSHKEDGTDIWSSQVCFIFGKYIKRATTKETYGAHRTINNGNTKFKSLSDFECCGLNNFGITVIRLNSVVYSKK